MIATRTTRPTDYAMQRKGKEKTLERKKRESARRGSERDIICKMALYALFEERKISCRREV
jgi:hypothetical protein